MTQKLASELFNYCTIMSHRADLEIHSLEKISLTFEKHRTIKHVLSKKFGPSGLVHFLGQLVVFLRNENEQTSTNSY